MTDENAKNETNGDRNMDANEGSANVSFDDQLRQLEEKVRELESGKLGLDEALERFEAGIHLTRTLKKRLDAAEGRVEELLRDGSRKPLDVDA